jgi:hypothetical protein
MLGDTYKTAQSFHTQATNVKWSIAKICHEIDEVMDKLGDENYCPYEDLEAIHEKLQKMTD